MINEDGHNEIYIANFQEDATWDEAYINIGDGEFLEGHVYTFYGDLKIIDLQIFKSESGYATGFGFDFSSKYGFLYKGDVSIPSYSLTINEFYLQPNSEGHLEMRMDENGLYFDWTFESGGGYVIITLYGLPIAITADDDNTAHIHLTGAILKSAKALFSGDVDGFVNYLLEAVRNGKESGKTLLDIVLNFKNMWLFRNGHWVPFAEVAADAIDQFLESHPNLPRETREKLEELSKELREQARKQRLSCFLAGTKIEMADGSLKNIEDIEVGDKVKSYDEKTGEWKAGVVTRVFHHSPEEMGDYYLIINHELRVTPNHPFYVNGRWITAGQLKIGDILDGNRIISVERVYKKVPTYNFEVEPYHTYKVVWGVSDVIAHNFGVKESASKSKGGDNSAAGDKVGSCFLAGTKIEMADGSLKNIEDIKIGDKVISYDVFTKQWKAGVVTEVFHHSPEEMGDYYLVINHELRVTPNHPLYLNGKWITAGGLKVGDKLGDNVIFSIERVYRRVPTYNFEVEPYHTYNIIWGNTKSVVHNAQQQKDTAWSTKFTCFLKGTPILMANMTYKPIEKIRPGEMVMGYDPESGALTPSLVVRVDHHPAYQMRNGFIEFTFYPSVNLPWFMKHVMRMEGTARMPFSTPGWSMMVTPEHPFVISNKDPWPFILQAMAPPRTVVQPLGPYHEEPPVYRIMKAGDVYNFLRKSIIDEKENPAQGYVDFTAPLIPYNGAKKAYHYEYTGIWTFAGKIVDARWYKNVSLESYHLHLIGPNGTRPFYMIALRPGISDTPVPSISFNEVNMIVENITSREGLLAEIFEERNGNFSHKLTEVLATSITLQNEQIDEVINKSLLIRTIGGIIDKYLRISKNKSEEKEKSISKEVLVNILENETLYQALVTILCKEYIVRNDVLFNRWTEKFETTLLKEISNAMMAWFDQLERRRDEGGGAPSPVGALPKLPYIPGATQKNYTKKTCFLAGTKIEMADGTTKNIEDIKVGDKVKSYDEKTGEWRVGTVTKVFHHTPEEMGDYYLVINHELRVTPNHPILVNGKWIHAGELKIGDKFGDNIIYSIERIYRKVPTYNLEVEPYHTYAVAWGKGISIVHNKLVNDDPQSPGGPQPPT